jgi:hypothetical protein
VTGTTQVVLGGPPAGTCDYSPPPFDVLSKDGVPAEAFAAFPLTFYP